MEPASTGGKPDVAFTSFDVAVPVVVADNGVSRPALIDPSPIPVPAGVTAAQAGKAAQSALIGRGWAVTHEPPGGIDATLTGHKYTAMIHVA